MDKFKIKLIPDSIDMFLKLILRISVGAFIIYIFTFFISCTDDTFLFGYNKDLEEIHQSMFEVDSLIMTIQMNLDSLNLKVH